MQINSISSFKYQQSQQYSTVSSVKNVPNNNTLSNNIQFGAKKVNIPVEVKTGLSAIMGALLVKTAIKSEKEQTEANLAVEYAEKLQNSGQTYRADLFLINCLQDDKYDASEKDKVMQYIEKIVDLKDSVQTDNVLTVLNNSQKNMNDEENRQILEKTEPEHIKYSFIKVYYYTLCEKYNVKPKITKEEYQKILLDMEENATKLHKLVTLLHISQMLTDGAADDDIMKSDFFVKINPYALAGEDASDYDRIATRVDYNMFNQNNVSKLRKPQPQPKRFIYPIITNVNQMPS